MSNKSRKWIVTTLVIVSLVLSVLATLTQIVVYNDNKKMHDMIEKVDNACANDRAFYEMHRAICPLGE